MHKVSGGSYRTVHVANYIIDIIVSNDKGAIKFLCWLNITNLSLALPLQKYSTVTAPRVYTRQMFNEPEDACIKLVYVIPDEFSS